MIKHWTNLKLKVQFHVFLTSQSANKNN